jgi:hypothetical protein
MTTQANISLPDAAAANHTFVASGVVDGVAVWYEKTAALVAGWFKLTTSLRMPPKPTDPMRLQLKLVKPTVVTETINGVTYDKVIRQILINVDVVCPPDSTTTERADVCKYVGTTLLDVTTAGTFGYQVKNADAIV